MLSGYLCAKTKLVPYSFHVFSFCLVALYVQDDNGGFEYVSACAASAGVMKLASFALSVCTLLHLLLHSVRDSDSIPHCSHIVCADNARSIDST